MTVGLSRILLIGYTVLALAATGRSAYEILTKFNHAPFAYTFSAVAAAHYFLAILAIARNCVTRWMSPSIGFTVPVVVSPRNSGRHAAITVIEQMFERE